MLEMLDSANTDMQESIMLAYDGVIQMPDINGLHSIWNNAQV